jgi:PAS domain S-box-containing protein/putative nucleotidyltransferase with HDIG domain
MEWIVPAQLVTLTGSLILVFTYLSLYLQERRKYLAVWLASWSLYTVRSIFEILVVLWGNHRMLLAMNLMSMVWSAALLFWGTCLFSGKKLNTGWLAIFAGGSLLIVAGISFRSFSPWAMILTFFLSAFASISTGITLLRFRQAKGPARVITSWAFILWGLHKADYPLLRPILWVAPFGYVLGAILGFVSAIGIILVFLESTKRELKASEEKYRSIFENAVEGIFQATPDGRFLSVNPAYARIYGYESAEELMADVKNIGTQTYAHPEDYQQFVRLLHDRGFIEGYERQRVRKDGTRIWVSSSARAVRNAAGAVLYYEGTVEDVTARREAEEALCASQLKLSEAMDLARIVHWEVDLATDEFVFNDPFYAIYGTTAEQEGGYRMSREEYGRRFVHPDDMWVFRQMAEKRLASRDDEFLLDAEHRIVRRDGEVCHIMVRAYVSRDAAARVTRYYGANQDITERKQAEETLSKKAAFLEALVNTSFDGILVVDSGGKKIFQNQKTAELWDIPQHVLDRGNLAQVQHATNAAKDPEQFAERVMYIYADPSEPSLDEVELSNGTTLERYSFPVLGQDGEYYGRIWGFHDITERKQAQEKLESTLGNLRKAIGGTIQAIVQVVEMRDPYTAGHQRRVADLARSIATEMGLPADIIEGIRMAAVIHDIGKVAVPAEILSKPGRLTQNEFELIKDHPLTGYDILKHVEFPWPIAEIIYQHHERLDGSGYPRGLKGDDVLLEARIIALADVVEAMASHRPFRPARGIDAALGEIEEHRGTLYDAEVVDTCLKLFREMGYALTERKEPPTSPPQSPASVSHASFPERDSMSR